MTQGQLLIPHSGTFPSFQQLQVCTCLCWPAVGMPCWGQSRTYVHDGRSCCTCPWRVHAVCTSCKSDFASRPCAVARPNPKPKWLFTSQASDGTTWPIVHKVDGTDWMISWQAEKYVLQRFSESLSCFLLMLYRLKSATTFCRFVIRQSEDVVICTLM